MEGFHRRPNLPAKDKMRAPRCRGILAGEVPELRTPEGLTLGIVASRSHGVDGAMQREATQPLYLGLHLLVGTRCILIAGQPLHEPIAQYEPVRDAQPRGNLPNDRGLSRRAAGMTRGGAHTACYA